MRFGGLKWEMTKWLTAFLTVMRLHPRLNEFLKTGRLMFQTFCATWHRSTNTEPRGRRIFFSPAGQSDTISQAAVKGRALSHPFPRWWHYRHIHKLLREEVTVKDYWASSSPQKTASKWRALNKLCLRLQPTFKTRYRACVYTCKVSERSNIRQQGNALLTPKACLHKIPKPKINLVMTMW